MDIELYQGDCLEIMPVKIPDKSVDMILCDLPYGTTACKWDVVIPFEPLWKEYNRIIKDRGCIALFGSESFSSHLRMSNIKNYKYDWVWNKIRPSGFALSKKRPLCNNENISIFYYKTCDYYPQMTKGKPSHYGYNKTKKNSSQPKLKPIPKNYTDDKYPKTIIEFSKLGASVYVHPTQKPVTLLEYLIKTYTLENETVLDNCMGSGSTGVACINTKRNFIGIEKEEVYFEIAKKRIEEAENSINEKLFI